MIFFASLGFIGSVFLPWWTVSVWSFLLGWWVPNGWRGAWQTAASAFLVWSAAAYYQNALAQGRIGAKISALFQLPSGLLLFLAVGLLGSFLTLPSYWLGHHLRLFLISKGEGSLH